MSSFLPISAGSTHEIRPSIGDILVGPERVELSLTLSIEPVLAGMNLSELQDTNDSPLAGTHDALRALDPPALERNIRQRWPELSTRISLQSGDTHVVLHLDEVQVEPVGNLDLPRDTRLVLSGGLPPGTAPVVLTWGEELGLLALRQIPEADAYQAMLSGGDSSAPLPRDRPARVVWAALFLNYVHIGFEHIVPKGLDHILFVLGLFFFAAGARPLLWQITTFTLAHTLTLALASLGIVSLSSSVVEPLIAGSIVYVAVENILGARFGIRRLLVVFGFGLLHGLGFATVLGDVGLEASRFVTGLVAFNIGVELGQLAVILATYLLVGAWFSHRPWYRAAIAIPVSAIIGLIGAIWFVERLVA